MERNEAALGGAPLLARLRNTDLQALGALGKHRKYRSGEIIFRQDDPGDSMHMVMDGSVRVTVLTPGGEEATVALLGPGEVLGELALLDGRPRSATATASGAAATFVVSREDFLKWLSQRPKAALALLETLSLRFRAKDEALVEVGFLNLSQRLAKRLVDLSGSHLGRRTSAKVGATDSIRLQITQERLASILGVSRQAVNKELNAFVRRGYVALGRGSVTVNDPRGLQSYSQTGR